MRPRQKKERRELSKIIKSMEDENYRVTRERKVGIIGLEMGREWKAMSTTSNSTGVCGLIVSRLKKL